jgi:hypothetical protein
VVVEVLHRLPDVGVVGQLGQEEAEDGDYQDD